MQMQMQRPVSTKEAAELVHMLLTTPPEQVAGHWPPLLTLLTRWAATAGTLPQRAAPARPWERQQQQQKQQQPQQHQHQRQQFLLMQQAVEAVQLGLKQSAQHVLSNLNSSGPATGLGQLFVPAVLFLAAAVDSSNKSAATGSSLDAACQSAVVAATCEAAAALAAAPAAVLQLAAPGIQQQGLPAVLASCKTLLLACKDDPTQSAWLVAALLSALQTAIPNILQHAQQQQQQEQQLRGPLPANLAPWLQQQLQGSVVCSVLGLVSGAYGMGHELGAAWCRSAASASAASGGSRLRGNDSRGSLQGLQAVVSVLQAACHAEEEEQFPSSAALLLPPLLHGLAGAVAAGLCAGLLEGLPPPPAAAVGSSASAQDSFGAAAAAAWGTPSEQPQPTNMHGHRQQLLHNAELLLVAVHAACGRCYRHGAQPAASPDTSAAAAVSCGLLGQAYGRLMSTCGHLVPLITSSGGQQPQQQHQDLSLSTAAGLMCTLQYLTHHCCSMSGVFYQVAGCHNAAAANAWLSAQQQQHPAQEVGMLARWVAATMARTAATQSSPQLLLPELLTALRSSAVELAASYSTYQLVMPAAVAAAVDAAAVRQQLDRTFALHTAVLSEVWQACVQSQRLSHQQHVSNTAESTAARDDAATGVSVTAAEDDDNAGSVTTPLSQVTAHQQQQLDMVALSLSDIAALQFCRVQLPAYVELVRGLVTAMASSSGAADAFIAEALPCYQQLVQAHPAAAATAAAAAEHPRAAPAAASCSSEDVASLDQQVVPAAVWLRDTVTAAQLSFLLPLLPVAVRAASSTAAAAERVLPLLLLLLPHPLQAVSQAAHAAFAGLLAIAADEQQQPPQQQQQRLMDVMQQAVPMYLQRSLCGLPSAGGSLEGLSSSYYSLLKNLPSGSALGQLAVSRIADRAVELAGAPAAGAVGVAGVVVSTAAATSKSSSSSSNAAQPSISDGAAAAADPNTAAANKLFELLVLSLQLGDYQLLPAMLKTIGGCVAAAPPAVQQQWMPQLYAGCLAVGDYTRKRGLMTWFDGLQQQLLVAAQQQQQRGQDKIGCCSWA